MLKVIQRFDKHCSCHLHGEYVRWGLLEAFFGGQAAGATYYFQQSTQLIPESQRFTNIVTALLWDPLNLLCNGYGMLLPQGKTAGG
jgi:hypothetical protein